MKFICLTPFEAEVWQYLLFHHRYLSEKGNRIGISKEASKIKPFLVMRSAANHQGEVKALIEKLADRDPKNRKFLERVCILSPKAFQDDEYKFEEVLERLIEGRVIKKIGATKDKFVYQFTRDPFTYHVVLLKRRIVVSYDRLLPEAKVLIMNSNLFQNCVKGFELVRFE